VAGVVAVVVPPTPHELCQSALLPALVAFLEEDEEEGAEAEEEGSEAKEGSEDGKEEGRGAARRTLLTPSQEAGPRKAGAQSSSRARACPPAPAGAPLASGGPAAALLSSVLALSGHRAARAVEGDVWRCPRAVWRGWRGT